jgi:ubiquinone/menaquinone biosynthesis C-methylase UbiE
MIVARAQVFLEGPLPASLSRELGIEAAPADRAGRVMIRDEALKLASTERCGLAGGAVSPPQTREVPHEPNVDWTQLRVPISAEQAERWRQPSWDAERWTVARGTEVLATWRTIGEEPERWPTIVRRDHLTVCSFGLLSYLSQCHSAEPTEGSSWRSSSRTLGLEGMLLVLIDQMHERAGLTRLRVLPWPEGMRWVLSIRHDVDRTIKPTEVREVLGRHRRAGTSATWYWRARHLDPIARRRRLRRGTDGRSSPKNLALRIVASDPRHEVAHHTELPWGKGAKEQRRIERVMGRPVLGTSAHGDPTCFRWQGAPNVLWADQRGLLYTELIQHGHMHPHRFAKLGETGLIELAEVICLPHHQSFDRSMTSGDTAADSVEQAAPTYVAASGMMQLLNHPDLNLDELFETLDRLPREERLDWTAAEAASWWRRTHVRGELTITSDENGRVRVTSRQGVHGAVVEALLPDGTVREFGLYLEPGSPATFQLGAAASRRLTPKAGQRDGAASWSALSATFAELVRAYHEHRAAGTTAATDSTVRTNSELVPRRARALLDFLRDLGGVDDLAGLRVLEVGSGFGALAAYLAVEQSPARLVAIDNRSEFVEGAVRVGADAAILNLEYRHGDMRTLDGIDDASFDVAIVNNSFIYLPTRDDMEQTLASIRRVLAPGGRVLLHHANRWRWREPFTQDPLVHLLTPRLAEFVGRRTGWRHNHGRVRLISVSGLKRMLRQAGFEERRVGASVRGRHTQRLSARLAGFYALTARRPESD